MVFFMVSSNYKFQIQGEVCKLILSILETIPFFLKIKWLSSTNCHARCFIDKYLIDKYLSN